LEDLPKRSLTQLLSSLDRLKLLPPKLVNLDLRLFILLGSIAICIENAREVAATTSSYFIIHTCSKFITVLYLQVDINFRSNGFLVGRRLLFVTMALMFLTN